MKKLRIVIAIFLTCGSLFSQTKDKEYFIRTLAFYNLENLFDTINQPNKDDELSPIMELKSGKAKVYEDKIDKLSYVISQIGKSKSKVPPAILGVAEVENSTVLQDLIDSKILNEHAYQFIHYESPDKRGIDVGLLYQPLFFQPIHHEAIPLRLYNNNKRIYTRDILRVSGYLDNELIHILVVHWPSRRGGKEETDMLRNRAAFEVQKAIKSIQSEEQNAKILVMGDFNDDPVDKSIKRGLQAVRHPEDLNKETLYNPFEQMFLKGMNTLGHRDQINLFDQILLSNSLVKKKNESYDSYKLYRASIFNPHFLITQQGKYKGYPFRSFSNGNHTGGYSDHFPVYIYLLKKK